MAVFGVGGGGEDNDAVLIGGEGGARRGEGLWGWVGRKGGHKGGGGGQNGGGGPWPARVAMETEPEAYSVEVKPEACSRCHGNEA